MGTLITGATGFIGSMLTKQLVAHNTDVRIFRRPTSSLDLLGPRARAVDHATGDLADARSLYRAMENVQRVYHVAAALGPGNDRATLHRVNVQGTANVVNAALEANIERLVFTSSIAALGRPVDDQQPIDETAPRPRSNERSAYACSKYNAELEVQRGIAEGLDAIIVNPALVFGVGRPGDNTRRIVDAVRNRWLPGVPSGGTCVVDVEDVAEGHRRAMAHGTSGERYILGSENLPWRTIVETLADAFGVDPPRYTLPDGLVRTVGLLSEAVAFVTRTAPWLPRSTARSLTSFQRYDPTKATEELDCSFRPFAETAQRISRILPH